MSASLPPIQPGAPRPKAAGPRPAEGEAPSAFAPLLEAHAALARSLDPRTHALPTTPTSGATPGSGPNALPEAARDEAMAQRPPATGRDAAPALSAIAGATLADATRAATLAAGVAREVAMAQGPAAPTPAPLAGAKVAGATLAGATLAGATRAAPVAAGVAVDVAGAPRPSVPARDATPAPAPIAGATVTDARRTPTVAAKATSLPAPGPVPAARTAAAPGPVPAARAAAEPAPEVDPRRATPAATATVTDATLAALWRTPSPGVKLPAAGPDAPMPPVAGADGPNDTAVASPPAMPVSPPTDAASKAARSVAPLEPVSAPSSVAVSPRLLLPPTASEPASGADRAPRHDLAVPAASEGEPLLAIAPRVLPSAPGHAHEPAAAPPGGTARAEAAAHVLSLSVVRRPLESHRASDRPVATRPTGLATPSVAAPSGAAPGLGALLAAIVSGPEEKDATPAAETETPDSARPRGRAASAPERPATASAPAAPATPASSPNESPAASTAPGTGVAADATGAVTNPAQAPEPSLKGPPSGAEPATVTPGASARATLGADPAVHGQRATLRLEGEGGVEGRLRVSLQGGSLRAVLVADDPADAGRLQSRVAELQRSLADRGFADARVIVQASGRDPAAEPRPARPSPDHPEDARPRQDERSAPQHDGSRRRPAREPRERTE